MATKKYINLENLAIFLESLRSTFSALSHKHTISDITDYAIDSELSSTSNNPVANSVLNAEFDAISDSFGALETTIDEYYESASQKTQVQIITWEDDD